MIGGTHSPFQGAKGNQWIAKMPTSGGTDQQAGLAYMSTDNSPKMRCVYVSVL